MESIQNFYNTILKSSHPILLAIHLSAKAAPIVFYILGSLFLGFTAQFITLVILFAIDFYLTKNISGRKLVQLRWWYDSTGQKATSFTFESYKQYGPGPPVNAIDSKLFWWSLYLTPVVWVVFAIFCVLRLKLFYLIVVLVGVGLTGWNAYGFRCCDKWDPNENASSSNSWFQLPDLSSFGNLSNLVRIQGFFNSSNRN
ncbi:hypothetical protein TBLA_0B01840 [Henningerozyma blattae CBS 6284]|uniref:Golgi apparatus membrane protein TVP23 n=1 Tax=Henningerozyma blattae (strain ATCC 34711 / CBS 6284 / DSM 70876 / NBRC 10599 / NRRL Y-10934 / UCD 77-7) TaxID=1071380 RepID=I2GY26_HENB6|nr:hypothetical protein TBLA_0B01840 [Tetrapisispora blattae CBS 6284]CCH59028.1 hypothetical protein TBLA_0B01840 [Tetrapisispora blattae CBS 6284]